MGWKGKMETVGFIILISLAQTAVSSGIVTVQLAEYDHRDGKDANGQCCESIWSSGCKANDCDPYFVLCLKKRTNGECVPKITTDRTTNVDHIHFGNYIGTTPNNIILNFIGLLSDLDLSIQVLDSDSDGAFDKKDDLLETLTHIVQWSPTMFSQQPPTFTDLQLNGAKTSISLRYHAQCDKYYYGQECDIMCEPHMSHYYCDDHGNKLCFANWTGPNCDSQTDYCWCSPCLNGGTCKDGNMTYTCTCLSDYTGQDCELSLATSTTTTALHTTANSTTRTTALHTNANSTTRTTTVLYTTTNSTTRTTALHTTANSTTRITALHTTANSTTRTTTALHTNANSTTRITALHTTANSTTRTTTALHTTANSTTRITTALHNNDNLTTTTATTTRLPPMTESEKTATSTHSLTNATTFQTATRLPNIIPTLPPFQHQSGMPNVITTLSPFQHQSEMQITYSTANRILHNEYGKGSPTTPINPVTISLRKMSSASIHRDPNLMKLLPIVGGAIAGTGILAALCGLLTAIMKRRENRKAELHKNREDTRKLAWT